MNWSPEHAEALPFNRANVAEAIGESASKVGNWIDRNRLWQTSRTHGYYRLKDVFDLGGFAALRAAHIPEKDCARYVFNFGFYRSFLHGDQLEQFSFRQGKWDIGVFDQSALVALTINLRTLGTSIFERIAKGSVKEPRNWADGFFESFQRLYLKTVEMDRLSKGSVSLFEGVQA